MMRLRDHVAFADREKRRSSRFVLLPPVSLVLTPLRPGTQSVYKSVIADLSADGLACQVRPDDASDLLPGDAIRLRFSLGQGGEVHRITARVVHQIPWGAHDFVRIGLVWAGDESTDAVRTEIHELLSEVAETTSEVA